MVVFRDFAHYRWLGIERGIIKSGKSSANLAFQMLKEMGFSKILLVGQDLAFDDEDKTHVPGADHSIVGMRKSNKIKKVMYVKGNYKEKIKTLATWDSFRIFYEADIKNYSGKVYNCTEGGAFIYGTQIVSLKEALDKYVKAYNPELIINKNLTISKKEINEDAKTVKESYLKGLEFIKFCKEKLGEANKYLREFDNKYKSEEDVRNMVYSDVQKIAQNLDQCKVEIWKHKQFYLFFTHISQSFNIAFETDINSLYAVFRAQYNYWITYVLLHRAWLKAMECFIECTMNYFADAIEIYNRNYGEEHGAISIEENLS